MTNNSLRGAGAKPNKRPADIMTDTAPTASDSMDHTPGRHWVEGSIYDGYAACVVGRVEVDGHADRDTRTLAHVRRLPDATLYAAAPDLYEVARMVVEASDVAGFSGPLGDAARAALAKARGEMA